MGNPDLVIIVNQSAFLINGTDYNQPDDAIDLAMKKFKEYQNKFDKLRYDENGNLYPDALEHWSPDENEGNYMAYNIIVSIKVYILEMQP